MDEVGESGTVVAVGKAETVGEVGDIDEGQHIPGPQRVGGVLVVRCTSCSHCVDVRCARSRTR